jgi:PiT family inorganic phosphate transporter
MMLGTSLSSFLFVLTSSLSGMPISTTHADVGALIGAGLAGVNSEDLNWMKVSSVAASWIVSPVVSGSLAALIFILISYTTLDNNFSV